MTAKEFLELGQDPDKIPLVQLPLIAEMMLLNLIPCGLCGRPTPMLHDLHYYDMDGVETCSACDEKIEWNRQQRWRRR
jgi:hypothetical protein